MERQQEIHLFFLLDSSGSMHRYGNVHILNRCMEKSLPEIGRFAREYGVRALVHVLPFPPGNWWTCGTSAETGVDALEAEWEELKAWNVTNSGEAIWRMANALSRHVAEPSCYRPIIVIFTAGCSMDPEKTREAIRCLKARRQSERIFIGLEGGDMAEYAEFATVREAVLRDVISGREEKGEFKMEWMLNEMGEMKSVLVGSVCAVMKHLFEEEKNDFIVLVGRQPDEEDFDKWPE